jgi:hypothetical protein
MKSWRVLQTLFAGAGIAGAAIAGPTDVPAGVHTVSEHWTTAGSPYRLKGQVYFNNMSTLTIDAGVLIVSIPSDQGSLAICRDSQIFVNGTAANPVIMTSTRDVHTWTGTTDAGQDDPNQVPGNSHTGVWRATSNEWGNLTLMGRGYISANNHGGATTNVPTPNANNAATMEGLTSGPATDLYGGGNDDDNSGSITYISLRYGGKVVGLNNELNGLSMGAIGRNTTVHHVDIMNCVDDGVETWGGTVNYKFLNIWNYGDDGFDTDEGWRGKAQFGLTVAGYNSGGSVGSGTSDHCFESDGAEDSDWEPCSTNSIYNFTAIHQPLTTRGITAWRDNNRTQYHNCIFMDSGGELVRFDNVDNDGAHGYGFNGTLSWAATWTTPYNAVPATPNDPPPGLPNYHNDSQCGGFLAEITDSVFFRNQAANAYTEATARGVLNASENNVLVTDISNAAAPIRAITRGTPVSTPTYLVLPVTSLDPRPANEALRTNNTPCDAFFDHVNYRGAFAPDVAIWSLGWTASDAFGFTPTTSDVMTSFCAPGVANVIACPCANSQVPAGSLKGCDNSSSTGGAVLSATGASSLSADTLVFTSSFEKPTATTIFLQGNASITFGLAFGQGVRCVGGTLKRLYHHTAAGGVATAPTGADVSVHAASAALGDVIMPGQVRYYMAYYRDPTVLGGCPMASTFNGTQGGAVLWQP